MGARLVDAMHASAVNGAMLDSDKSNMCKNDYAKCKNLTDGMGHDMNNEAFDTTYNTNNA